MWATILAPQLLEDGHNVIVYDIMYFGTDALPLGHPNLTAVEGDIRDTAKLGKARMR